jgi:lipoprotein-anchoring transpeptidase ErfK/SrfK
MSMRTVVRVVLIALAAVAVAATHAARPASAAPVTSFPAAGELVIPSVTVRDAPRQDARAVRQLRQFRPDFHPEIVLALASAEDDEGRTWYRISLPGRPNGRRGWIRSDLVDVRPVANRITIRRGTRTLEVRRIRDGRLLLRARVAVGKPSAQTPFGRDFYVRSRFVPSNSFLGVFALETSAYAPRSDWPGPGIVGIHGTSAPSSIGRAVSHGCVRMLNRDVARLKRMAPLGTPVDVLR